MRVGSDATPRLADASISPDRLKELHAVAARIQSLATTVSRLPMYVPWTGVRTVDGWGTEGPGELGRG